MKNYTLKNISEHNTSFFEPITKRISRFAIVRNKNFFKEVETKYGYVGMELNILGYNIMKLPVHRIHISCVFPDDWSVYYVDCGEDSAETVFYNYGYPILTMEYIK